MKLMTYWEDGACRLGVKLEHGVLDVAAAAAAAGLAAPQSAEEALAGGDAALRALRAVVEAQRDNAEAIREERALDFAPCVTRPEKIICVGLNYRKHAEETNAPLPEYPVLFNKFGNALTGNGCDVALPRSSQKVDYEAELAIVIGKTGKYISEEEALDYVFGYCAANDLSARDLQSRTSQWLAGKSCDGFLPLGPYLVSKDEVGDPNGLAISCAVNGEIRQQSHTSDMIFDCTQIVSYASQCFTLSPGDIILTGTPEGVVLGMPKEKQVYLRPGDVVTVEIEKLGSITNRMVKEEG